MAQYDFSQLDFSRIAVIGCPGSGKTTFTNKLGTILQRDVYHLDKLLWKPNWEMLPYDERKDIHDGIIFQQKWVIDGMWRSHVADRYARATLVIFLDFKRRVCMSRAVCRRIKYAGKQRDDIADGCLEKLDGYFLKTIWTFNKKVRPQILQLQKQNSETARTVTLCNPKQAEEFLQQLQTFAHSQNA